MTDQAPPGFRPEPAPATETPVQARPAPRTHEGIGFVMDVPVDVTVEIGRKTMRIGELLKLGVGAVLELDKPSGEPLDIYVNGRPIARGEAVVVGDRYGVRVTEVLAAEDARARAEDVQ